MACLCRSGREKPQFRLCRQETCLSDVLYLPMKLTAQIYLRMSSWLCVRLCTAVIRPQLFFTGSNGFGNFSVNVVYTGIRRRITCQYKKIEDSRLMIKLYQSCPELSPGIDNRLHSSCYRPDCLRPSRRFPEACKLRRPRKNAVGPPASEMGTTTAGRSMLPAANDTFRFGQAIKSIIENINCSTLPLPTTF